ncbi:hypothetical protein ACH5RR_012140 [Cinchona calisaya]|uniref:Mannitol dehydrogenase n=1 Tax=Cinchona calisaya TaxID=153742 RepID=A0ABD3A706_9GENT
MPLFDVLKPHGKLIMVGAPTEPNEIVVPTLIMSRKMVGWAAAAGLKETREIINFAAEHNITADIELLPMDYVNKAMDRLAKNDVRYRFVLDIANTLKED